MENWNQTPTGQERTFTFGSFSDAITWMFACSLEIEQIERYPEWTNTGPSVAVRLPGDEQELAELLDEHYSLLMSKKRSSASDGE